MSKKPIYSYLLLAILNPVGIYIFMVTGWLCGDKPIIIIGVLSVLSIVVGILCLKIENKKICKLLYYIIPVCGIILFPILIIILAGYAKFEDSILNKTLPFIWMNACWIAQIIAAYFTFKKKQDKFVV